MPSVDELLNMAEVAEVTFTETNDKIEIDADTRTMIIPDTERIFGVMSDEKGERKYFRCKRFVGNGIDLSKLDLRVIYQNASGLESGKDKYIVTDLKTDGEDYVTFSWELSRKVTAYKGIISFIVCATKTGTDGIITNEWNTTLANGGFSTSSELIEYIDAMIDYMTPINKKYIVFGIHHLVSTVTETFEMIEKNMTLHFGRHYINQRKYMLEYGLSDAGITPTVKDTTAISQGKIPPSLLYDDVHYNDKGYNIIATLAYERGKELDYW